MKKTGFDRYVDARMKDRKFAAAYAEARAEIDSVDALMQAVETVRAKAGLTKAELARRTRTRPEAIRRLFTTETPNPTVATLLSILRSMGYSLALVPASGPHSARRTRKAA
jgi:DNA-binding phage protein